MRLLMLVIVFAACSACGNDLTAPSPQKPYVSLYPNPPLTPRDPNQCQYLNATTIICPVR